jgi:hypothetical protein
LGFDIFGLCYFRRDFAPQLIKRDLPAKGKYTAAADDKVTNGPRQAAAGFNIAPQALS